MTTPQTPQGPYSLDQMHSRFHGMTVHEALLCSGAVRRYHTHPYLIGEQTVATHTFRAMALMISLWPEYTPAALVALLCHDGAEGAVGDVPSPTKWIYPELGRILGDVENDVAVKIGLPIADDLPEYDALWVKVCDWLEGAFFAIDQMRLGNEGMGIVHEAYVNGLNTLQPRLSLTDWSNIREAHKKHLGTLGTRFGLRHLNREEEV